MNIRLGTWYIFDISIRGTPKYVKVLILIYLASKGDTGITTLIDKTAGFKLYVGIMPAEVHSDGQSYQVLSFPRLIMLWVQPTKKEINTENQSFEKK